MIAEARKNFVCVRLGQMNQVDLARFEFDYDTTWTSFFLNADLQIYSRYGGRDQRIADARMSETSLLQTMSEVQTVHQKLQAMPVEQRTAALLRETHPIPTTASVPEDIPLLKENHEGCVHCHQVQEYRYLQAFQDGKFDRNLLFGYPLPEKLGIHFASEHGHRVERVDSGSDAERAGLKSGDLIQFVNSVPIRSEYDLRWALHRSNDNDPCELVVARSSTGKSELPPDEGVIRLKLTPSGNWRQSDLGWRKSLRSVPLPMGFLGYTLGGEGLKQAGFPPEKSVLKVISLRPPGLAANVQLQKGDYIIAVGGQTDFRSLDHFKSRLLELYRPGETVKLLVIRNGQEMTLEGLFPDWFTTENSVP